MAKPDLNVALASIDEKYRTPLIKSFLEIETNYRLCKWQPAELNGGRFAECVYSIIECIISGVWGAGPSKPHNMVDACKRLEAHNAVHGRSLCILIPRILPALYEIRNNRNVGHVGGDVDPNEMDATLTTMSTRWIMAELIRVFHGLTLEDAKSIIHSCIEFDIPDIWAVSNVKRVMISGLSVKEKSLILLYSNQGEATPMELLEWTEYGNKSRFVNGILNEMHSQRLVEFPQKAAKVILSPLGVREAERLLSK